MLLATAWTGTELATLFLLAGLLVLLVRAWPGPWPAVALSVAGVAAAALIVGLERVLSTYQRTRPEATPWDLFIAITTEPTRIMSIRLAERKAAGGTAPVFMYLFAFETDVAGGKVKAGHGLEVPFVFDLTDEAPMTGSRPEKADVAAAMSTAWLAFARTGDPNHDGIPEWPRYDTTTRATLVFDVACRVELDPLPEERVVWAGADIHMD